MNFAKLHFSARRKKLGYYTVYFKSIVKFANCTPTLLENIDELDCIFIRIKLRHEMGFEDIQNCGKYLLIPVSFVEVHGKLWQ